MKKILILAIFLIFQSSAMANYMPSYYNSVQFWGIGAVLAPHEFTLYEAPFENSKKITTIKWNSEGSLTCDDKECKNDIFVAFVPSKNYAVLAAEDENGTWAQVYYNQNANKTAWMKFDNETKFFTWSKFILAYGKKHGFYLFKDIQKEKRKLYAQPADNAQTVDSFELAKYISPWFVSGNWLMVKLLHYDNEQKTGWLHWRDSDGKLWGFVNLAN